MIVYRAIQGFIGGGMIPTAFAAAYTVFPQRAQGMVMALVGLTVTLAPTVGPTDRRLPDQLFSWHWLFLVNVIPGIVAATIAWLFVDFDEPDYALLRRFDFVGLGRDGGLSRQPGVRAGGGAAQRLVRRPDDLAASRSPSGVGGGRLLRPGADRARRRSSTCAPSATATSRWARR